MVLASRGCLCIANLLFILSIHIVESQSRLKSVTLTPSNTNSSGIYVLNHVEEVSIVNNNQQWRVSTTKQSSWHFIIYLNSSWGFDPTYRSTIKFSVDSPSIARPHTFNDLLFAVSSLDNTQYFSLWIPMHSNGDTNKIYPGCDSKAIPTQTFAVGDIASRPDYDRNCDVAGGSCANWVPFPSEHYIEQNRFPLHITLENDPESNRASVSFASRYTTKQSCGFIRFYPNNGLKLFVGGNDHGERFLVNSFNVEHEVFLPPSIATDSPTFVPTESPTQTTTMAPAEITTLAPITAAPTTSAPTTSASPTSPPTLTPITTTTTAAPLTPKPTARTLTCGDSVTDMLHHGFQKNSSYALNVPGNLASLTITTCDPLTTIESTITLWDETMQQQIAYDENGCNDKYGRAKLVVDNVAAGHYMITVGSTSPDVEGLFAMYITCTISTDMVGFCNMFGLY